MKVFLYKNDRQEGPYDLPELQEGLAEGRMSLDDLVWAEGATEWAPLRTLIPRHHDSANTPAENSPAPPLLDPAYAHLAADEQDPASVATIVTKALDLLTHGEKIEYVAVQKKHLLALAPDCILITNKRYLVAHPKLMGMSFEDHAWRDIANVHLSEQAKTATLLCTLAGGHTVTVDNLPPKQARRIHAYAQEMDEKLLQERRQRLLREKRALVADSTTLQTSFGTAHTEDDPVVVLTKLKKMLDAGLIEQAEYDSKKVEVLARM